MKNDIISIIGPYGTICGVAEYQRFFAEALIRAKKEVHHISCNICPAYPSHGIYDDTPNVTRVFGTGHFPPEQRAFDDNAAFDAIVKSGSSVVYLNYQDYLYPDKTGLARLLARVAAKGIRLYLLVHDSCLPPQMALPYQLFKKIIVPSKLMQASVFPTATRVEIIQQGAPIFKKYERSWLREALVLPPPQKLMLATFGLGRSNNKEVFEAAAKASEVLGLTTKAGNHIHTLMLYAKLEDANQAVSDFDGVDYDISGGYLEDFKLSAYLQAADAVVINYPQIRHYATSSALRFAIGSNCLVFAKETNWFADVRDVGMYVPFDSVNSLVNAIVNTFETETRRKFVEGRVLRNAENWLKHNNWDEIAKKHIALWSRA